MFMKTQPERIRVNTVLIRDLLDKKFLDLMEKEELKLDPVSLIFICNKETEGKRQLIGIAMNHQNDKELEDKILHIDCIDPDIMDNMLKVLEKVKK